MQKVRVTKVTDPSGGVTWDVDWNGEPDGLCDLNQKGTEPGEEPQFECIPEACEGECKLDITIISPTVKEYCCLCEPLGDPDDPTEG